MSERDNGYSSRLGEPAAMYHLPGMSSPSTHQPAVRPSDHLVEPETSRMEYVRGQPLLAQPAGEQHADHHCRLDYVVSAKVASGYIGSSDLLTRRSEDSDFATDTCIRKQGINPLTGQRHLEEITFEVAYTQRRSELAVRAQEVVGHGVRRMFAIFVRDAGPNGETEAHVHEWSPERNDWMLLPRNSVIEDPCFAEPVPVKALIDATEADNAVAQALLAKRNPVIVKAFDTIRDESFHEGRQQGIRESQQENLRDLREQLLAVIAHKDIQLDAAQRSQIYACTKAESLRHWFRQALAGELVIELGRHTSSYRA